MSSFRFLLIGAIVAGGLSSRPAVAEDEFFTPTTTIGGYGEMHYNFSKKEDEDATKKLDFHRFVLFYSHAWTDRWSFKAEVELEHNFVSDGEGELELEQAHIDYHHSSAFGFQAGVVLPSVGLLNEFHEPPLFLSVERPDYAKNIVPTTWFGNGLAVYSRLGDFDLKATVMEGLSADAISASGGIRGGRLKGYKADASELLFNARVDFIGIQGLKAGASVSNTEAMGDTISDIQVTLVEAHATYWANNVIVTTELGSISYDSGELEQSNGFYVDLGYNIGPAIGMDGDLIPWIRLTDYNTASKTASGGDSEKKHHYSKWMAGLTHKPISSVVFKVDYGVKTNDLSDGEEKLFNLGTGYMF